MKEGREEIDLSKAMGKKVAHEIVQNTIEGKTYRALIIQNKHFINGLFNLASSGIELGGVNTVKLINCHFEEGFRASSNYTYKKYFITLNNTSINGALFFSVASDLELEIYAKDIETLNINTKAKIVRLTNSNIGKSITFSSDSSISPAHIILSNTKLHNAEIKTNSAISIHENSEFTSSPDKFTELHARNIGIEPGVKFEGQVKIVIRGQSSGIELNELEGSAQWLIQSHINSLKVHNTSLESLSFEKGMATKKIEITADKKHAIKHLQLPPLLKSEGAITSLLKVEGIVINKLTLEGKTESGSYQFLNTHIENLKFKDFRNEIEFFQFKQCQIEKTLSLKDSFLNTMEFINCDLSQLQAIYYQNSSLSDLKLIGVTWSRKMQVKTLENNQKSRKQHTQIREVYKQLKQVVNSSNDSLQENRFKAKELKHYHKSLKWNRQNLLDKINLQFSYWSNEYGISWGRGVLFTIATALLFYNLYAVARFGVASSLSEIDAGFHVKNWINFLNPAHRIDITKETATSILPDYLGRIFVGYGIYQTITAFRKIGK